LALLADALFLAVLGDNKTYAGGFIAAFADHHQVGQSYRSLYLDDPALLVLTRLSFVFFDHVYGFDQCFIAFGEDLDHFAFFAPVLALEHFYGIAFFQLVH
jgi:hypothetical protein